VVPSGPGTEGAETLLAVDSVDGLLGLRNAIAAADNLPDLMLIDTRPDENRAVLNACVAADERLSTWRREPVTQAAMQLLCRGHLGSCSVDLKRRSVGAIPAETV